MSENQYSEIAAFESAQGSVLQSYRSIFISTQSILFAVATFVASQSQGSCFSLVLVPLGICLSVSWYCIDWYRGLDELFFDSCLLRHEEGEKISNVFSNYYEWSKKTRSEKIEFLKSGPRGDEVVDISKRWLSTRGVMGKLLPTLFAVLWIALALIVLISGRCGAGLGL